MNIAVLGAGAWGTALAVSAAQNHRVVLWARDAVAVCTMARERCNARYLPGVALARDIDVCGDLSSALAHAGADGLVVVATPTAALRAMLAQCAGSRAAVVWLCKGFEAGSGALGPEVAAQTAPELRVGVLSGPSFAIEVAQGLPTALVAASTDSSVCETAMAALHSDSLRVYSSPDPMGVAVGGAVKNVIAIATGIADGMARPGGGAGLGLNARAALITRGLAETTRLGLALGARADTFMGLSGLGDLVLTATGDLSRNRQVGLRLAQGEALARVLGDLGHVSEGVYSASTVLARAQALGVDMPITAAVVEVLHGRWSAAQALAELMGRGARAEALTG